MPDNAELIEKYDDELWHTIYKMHKDGIRYEVAHHLLQGMTKSLDTMSYSEAYLSQHAPQKPKAAS